MRHRAMPVNPSVAVSFLGETAKEWESILFHYGMSLFLAAAISFLSSEAQLCQNVICFVLQEAA